MRPLFTYLLIFVVALVVGAYLWGALHTAWLAEFEILPHHKWVKYGALLTAFTTVAASAWFGGRTASAFGFRGTTLMFLSVGALAFVLTSLILLSLWALLLTTGLRQLEVGFAWAPLWLGAGGVLITGVTVALFEEWFFRGALLTRTHPRWIGVWLVSSVLYAGFHLLQVDEAPALVGQWGGGGQLLWQAVTGVPEQWAEHPSFIVLLLFLGLLLGLLRIYFNQIALCISVHAAAVIGFKLFQRHTDPGTLVPTNEWLTALDPALASLGNWLGTDVLGGWMSTLWMAVICGLLFVGLSLKRLSRSYDPVFNS